MADYCWSCKNELVFDVKVGVKVGRGDTCPHCASDLRCCKNCGLFDPSLENQCREPEATFVRDREQANFCAHFDFRHQGSAPAEDDRVAQAKAKLDALFKNLK